MGKFHDAFRASGSQPPRFIDQERVDHVVRRRLFARHMFNKDINLLYIQFSFSNSSRVPTWLPRVEEETCEERLQRKNMTYRGITLIEATMGVNVTEFVETALASNLLLVNAYSKERIAREGAYRAEYQMARYVFARERKMMDEPRIRFLDTLGAHTLRELGGYAWRVRAYCNPFFLGGFMIEGKYQVSINCEVLTEKKVDEHYPSLALLPSGWPTINTI